MIIIHPGESGPRDTQNTSKLLMYCMSTKAAPEESVVGVYLFTVTVPPKDAGITDPEPQYIESAIKAVVVRPINTAIAGPTVITIGGFTAAIFLVWV